MATVANIGQELKIICGVPRAPGDTASAEDALQVLDLLNGIQSFGVAPDGWMPQLPQVKNVALWAETGISDGRQLISGPVGNVTETIRLASNAATLQGRYYVEKELMRFGALARDFWQTFGQIQPVYLKWFAPDALGPQYALIYTLEIAQRGDPFSGNPMQEITLSIEREPYWRGIAPGANPKLWTFEFRKEKFTFPELDLSHNSSRNLAQDTTENRREWDNTTTYAITNNCIDIPASDIPGDAPALTCIVAHAGSSEGLYCDRIYFARSTKATSLTARRTGAKSPQQMAMLNAADGEIALDASIVADANAPISNSTGAGRRVEISFATPAMNMRFRYNGGAAGVETWLDPNTMRGRYAVFMRARLSAAATVHAYANLTLGSGTYSTTPVLMKVGVGGTPSWYLHYMGIIEIPLDRRAAIGGSGIGLDVDWTGNNNLFLSIYAERTAGAGSLYVADVILMPMDEAFLAIDDLNLNNANMDGVYDNTGYFSHGGGEIAANYFYNGTDQSLFHFQGTGQIIGSPLTLLPGVNNRIYLLAVDVSKGSPIAMSGSMRVNIVPRWSGVRDV